MRTILAYILPLALIAIISCGKDEEPRMELLDNIELEEGFGKPVGWNFFISSSDFESEFDFEWTTLEALSGEKSLRIFIDSEIRDEFASWTRTELFEGSFEEGREIELTAWIKGNMIGEGVSILVRGDRNGEIIFSQSSQQVQEITGNFDWKKVGVRVTPEESIDSISIFLIMLGDTKGEVYFDNVSLTER